MHNEHVRNWVIFSIVFLYVIVARDRLINALFSIWVGIWTMARIFKYLFNPANETANLTLDKFIPDRFIWLGLLSKSTRKQTSLIIMWWLAGILAALLTYNLLKILFISS
jgi:hypothetical protein